jgi:hypothetical protein
MNKKLVENSSLNIPRIKSLIKPPPSRTSWELLLDDYLKDPNFKSKLSPNNSQLYKQSTHPSSQPTSPNPFQQTFISSSYSQYPPCQTKSFLPPRRYQMTLDELVYLISQVGRSDLYREIVQYIKTQPLPTSSNISSSHSINKPSNMNACSTRRSTESFFLHNNKKKKS